ncbi:MBL fold metallo-hydrolase [Actinomycetospora straminea]|uniref:MBL fold metallo-hydrolase n=1 Tax=Actinomycetospora straminea TaxID=663607 RepID=UPI002365CBA1|nr:MBL fold metallo-hydrolase [Actinomycetospora straminea]MDD7931470.1 MBL fold metallo-hydrolase [Actinomycetospora straminea]
MTVIPVGWVGVRRSHVEFGGPWSLRYAAIAVDRRWAPWLPVNVVLIEHRRGIVLVDTGEAVDQPPGHFGCGDRVQESIYRRYLRLPVRAGADAPARLRALGVAPDAVDTVVLTHLHGDHTGNLPAFARAEVVVGPGEVEGYPGATACRVTGRRLVRPRFEDGGIAGFARSTTLVDDGSVRAVPLPGHTIGHLGVVVDGARPTVIAGDAALSYEQLRRRGTPGVARDRTENRRTQERLDTVARAGGQVVLSHAAPDAP